MIRSARSSLTLAATSRSSAPTSSAAGQAAQRDTTLELAVVTGEHAFASPWAQAPNGLEGPPRRGIGHTLPLASSRLFQHESADGSTFRRASAKLSADAGSRSWSVGENLVFGSAPFAADDAMQAWLDSPPHRQEPAQPAWREIGVGAVIARAPRRLGGDTVVLVTADFGARSR